VLPFNSCGPFTPVNITCEKNSDVEMVRSYRPPCISLEGKGHFHCKPPKGNEPELERHVQKAVRDGHCAIVTTASRCRLDGSSGLRKFCKPKRISIIREIRGATRTFLGIMNRISWGRETLRDLSGWWKPNVFIGGSAFHQKSIAIVPQSRATTLQREESWEMLRSARTWVYPP
jgi:hypothetical protein